MSLRIIHIALSGGHRKVQAKGIRYAHGNDLFQRGFSTSHCVGFTPPASQPTELVFRGSTGKLSFSVR
jgi:hypothetical protein